MKVEQAEGMDGRVGDEESRLSHKRGCLRLHVYSHAVMENRLSVIRGLSRCRFLLFAFRSVGVYGMTLDHIGCFEVHSI